MAHILKSFWYGSTHFPPMDPHSLASLGNQFWLKTSQNYFWSFVHSLKETKPIVYANACHSLSFHWGNMAVKLGTSVQCLQMVPRVVWPRPPLANCAGCPSRLRSTLCRIEKDHCGSAVSCRGVDPRWFGLVSENMVYWVYYTPKLPILMVKISEHENNWNGWCTNYWI